ncbi:antitoxin [Mycobacterium sp. smrl_JER01]|uniref:antitoxin n=1 Tax=Mycobacterium sp. smrl_JER01 TaxID=3402633 RepID=UPI003AC0B208
MGFLDKAKDLLSKNADKVDTVIDKAGDLVDKKTQGKYASTVDKVQDAAKKAVADTTADKASPGPADQAPVSEPASEPPPGPQHQQPPTAPPVS